MAVSNSRPYSWWEFLCRWMDKEEEEGRDERVFHRTSVTVCQPGGVLLFFEPLYSNILWILQGDVQFQFISVKINFQRDTHSKFVFTIIVKGNNVLLHYLNILLDGWLTDGRRNSFIYLDVEQIVTLHNWMIQRKSRKQQIQWRRWGWWSAAGGGQDEEKEKMWMMMKIVMGSSWNLTADDES